MRTPLEFETYVDSKDALGQPIESWQFFCRAWGKVRPMRGDRKWAVAQAQSDVTSEIDLRYIPALVEKLRADTEKVRVKQGERVHQIRSFVDPDERRKKLLLYVTEGL